MTVLVTGAASGVGYAVCDALRTRECPTYGLDIVSGEHVDRLTDVTKREAVREAVEEAPGIWGVVNCAGVNIMSPLKDINMGEARHVMDVNLWGSVNTVLETLPQLIRNAGVVCNVISSAARRPMTHSLAYNASKAALEMATRQLAHELAPSVTVFGVSPVRVQGTAMTERIDRTVMNLRGWTAEELWAKTLGSLLIGPAAPELLGTFIATLLLRALDDPQLSGTIVDYGTEK